VHIIPSHVEWDSEKALSNVRKHGIDFADAVSALEDNLAVTIPDNLSDEERFVTVGMDVFDRILVVVYARRGERVRIISARKATPQERRTYEERP
jgi:uncharacterized DUF497 family protein